MIINHKPPPLPNLSSPCLLFPFEVFSFTLVLVTPRLHIQPGTQGVCTGTFAADPSVIFFFLPFVLLLLFFFSSCFFPLVVTSSNHTKLTLCALTLFSCSCSCSCSFFAPLATLFCWLIFQARCSIACAFMLLACCQLTKLKHCD